MPIFVYSLGHPQLNGPLVFINRQGPGSDYCEIESTVSINKIYKGALSTPYGYQTFDCIYIKEGRCFAWIIPGGFFASSMPFESITFLKNSLKLNSLRP